ncbi:MAG: extracellular solute-binding protein [Gemmobacter sp.]|nr:extracellular solute-binding protein [Gemmobacter sp.]
MIPLLHHPFWFLRHGETVANAADVIAGSTDSPLTAQGQQQADQAALPVARGEKAYGIIIEYMAMNAKAKGSPVDFVYPAEGVSVITQPVAILNGSDAVDAAKVFVDWQMGRAAQEQSVAQGYFPILQGVAQPAGYPDPATLTLLPADYGRMLSEDAKNKETFADLFGG